MIADKNTARGQTMAVMIFQGLLALGEWSSSDPITWIQESTHTQAMHPKGPSAASA